MFVFLLSTESQGGRKEARETGPLRLPATDETKVEQEEASKTGWSVLWLHEEGKERLCFGCQAASKKKIAPAENIQMDLNK